MVFPRTKENINSLYLIRKKSYVCLEHFCLNYSIFNGKAITMLLATSRRLWAANHLGPQLDPKTSPLVESVYQSYKAEKYARALSLQNISSWLSSTYVVQNFFWKKNLGLLVVVRNGHHRRQRGADQDVVGTWACRQKGPPLQCLLCCKLAM